MDYWHADMTNSRHFFVEFNGKREGPTCVEANSEDGWIIREWEVGDMPRRRKFYGNVFIVRFKGLST
jgi:hypothetical protein